MTQRLRDISHDDFYRAIGINRLGGERLPHSPVRQAVTIYLDDEGNEIGRVERSFARASSRGIGYCYIAAHDADDQPTYSSIWL